VKIFGLPTFPIADAMIVGKRPPDELQWLIDRGSFTSWHNKHMICKIDDNQYQLLVNSLPIPRLEAEAATLGELIRNSAIPIALYQWHVNYEE